MLLRRYIKAPFFVSAFERHPPLAAALLPDLAELVGVSADKASARGEYLRLEAAKLMACALALGRRRSPAVAAAALKHAGAVGAGVAGALRAPCSKRSHLADTAKQALNVLEVGMCNRPSDWSTMCINTYYCSGTIQRHSVTQPVLSLIYCG